MSISSRRVAAAYLRRKTAWDWRLNGIPPRESRLVGQVYKGKVLQELGVHPSGGTFAVIPRDTRGMRGIQDPYQKVVLLDGKITHDFGSIPQLSRRARTDLWMDRTVSPKGVRYPKSIWDKLPQAPFKWATPAANTDGTYPEPWRVVDKDYAENWLKKLFRYPDLYLDFESNKFRGKERLWVGLRDNRDRQAHLTRILMMFDDLKKARWPVMMSRDGRGFWLVDDIMRDTLR